MDVCQIMFKIQKQNLIYHTSKHLMFTHLCSYCHYLWLFLCLSLQENNTVLVPDILHIHRKVWLSHWKKPAIYRCCRYRCIKMIWSAIVIKESLIECARSEAEVHVNWKRQGARSISPTDELVRTAAAHLPVWPADVNTSPLGPVNCFCHEAPCGDLTPGPLNYVIQARSLSAWGLFSEGNHATI